MAKILSQSETTNSEFKNFFVPTFAGGILFFILGAALLLIYNLNQIINWVGTNYLDSKETLHLHIGVLSSSFGKSFDSAFGGRLGQIIVWSLVGALCYILIWFLKNVLNSFENDVIVDHYLHPKNYSRAGYWGSAFAGIIFFGVVLILTVSYTYLAVKAIMPGTSALANSALNDFRMPLSIFYVLLATGLATAVIYIETLLIRTLSRLWKLF